MVPAGPHFVPLLTVTAAAATPPPASLSPAWLAIFPAQDHRRNPDLRVGKSRRTVLLGQQSVLLHLTTITKPTTAWDLSWVTAFSRQRLFQKSTRQKENRDPLSASAAKLKQEEASPPSAVVGMAPTPAG